MDIIVIKICLITFEWTFYIGLWALKRWIVLMGNYRFRPVKFALKLNLVKLEAKWRTVTKKKCLLKYSMDANLFPHNATKFWRRQSVNHRDKSGLTNDGSCSIDGSVCLSRDCALSKRVREGSDFFSELSGNALLDFQSGYDGCSPFLSTYTRFILASRSNLYLEYH